MDHRRCIGLALVCFLVAVGVTARGDAPPQEEGAADASAYTEDDLFEFLEDEMVVTSASQLGTKLTEVPQAVYVITRDEIERSGAVNIADLLRYVPGLIVSNPTASQWSVGVDFPLPQYSTLVLVLIDGRATYAPFSVINQWWPIPYAPADIERVEVVLGPGTTIHGSHAIAGVVNFITRGADQPGATGRVMGGGSQSVDGEGRFGDLLAHGAGAVEWGPFRLRAGLGYERLTPWDDPPMYRDGRLIPQPDAQRGLVNLRLESDLSEDSQLLLFAGASLYEGAYVSFGPGLLQGLDAHLDAELRFQRLLGDHDELSVRAYYRHKWQSLEAPFDTLLPGVPFHVRDHSALARVVYTTPLPANNRLAAALEARLDHSDMELFTEPGRLYSYFSAFVQDELRPLESLIITGGVRLETQFRQGLGFFDRLVAMPQLSTVWLPWPGHSLRLSYGQAMYYQAGFYEYGEQYLHDELLIFYGNPNIASEPMHTWELGYRGQLHSALLLTLSYTCRFNPTEVWITQEEGTVLPLTTKIYSGNNFRHALDVTASLRPSSLLRLDLALTWLIANVQAEGFGDAMGQASPLRLSAKGYLSPHDDVDFGLEVQYVAEREARSIITGDGIPIAGWFRLNARLAYTISDDPKLQIFGLATNITDTHFGDGLRAEMPDHGVSRVGRRFLFGVGAEL